MQTQTTNVYRCQGNERTKFVECLIENPKEKWEHFVDEPDTGGSRQIIPILDSFFSSYPQ